MTAMRTIKSASLGAFFVAFTVPARAEPADVTSEDAAGEVREEPGTTLEPPGEVTEVPASPPRRAPTGTFEIGAGYGTDDGFIAQTRIAQSSLFGSGHRLALSARMSMRSQLFHIGYDVPNLAGGDLMLRTELYARRDQLPGFQRAATGGGALVTAPVGDHLQAFFGYRIEEVKTTVDVEPESARGGEAPPITARDGRIASLRGGLVYSTLDQPYLPTRGMEVGTSIAVADPRWGSEIQLTRFDGWGSLHQALGPFTMHLGGSVSTVASRDDAGVPLAERLHLDGSSMLRGFAPGSIGPRDARTGMSLGGNLEYSARGELEVPLIRRLGISAVGFIDHAGIYDVGGAGSSGTSVGFGLIWRSPIGPLRFDWAIPLDGDGKPRFVFGFGTGF
ncbi:hypothetical protein BH11MYX3_BH11MYX3_23420 [soil metagenome]